MRVAELMTRDVRFCRATESMNRAAEIMWDRDCGCVPIVDEDDQIRGVITDRDIAMAAYTKANTLRAMNIAEGMSRAPRTCMVDDRLEDALAIMAEAQLHRLPVVDEQDRLLGVLSLADVIQALGGIGRLARRPLTERVVETLTEVTRPRLEPEPSPPKKRKPGKRIAQAV